MISLGRLFSVLYIVPRAAEKKAYFHEFHLIVLLFLAVGNF